MSTSPAPAWSCRWAIGAVITAAAAVSAIVSAVAAVIVNLH